MGLVAAIASHRAMFETRRLRPPAHGGVALDTPRSDLTFERLMRRVAGGAGLQRAEA